MRPPPLLPVHRRAQPHQAFSPGACLTRAGYAAALRADDVVTWAADPVGVTTDPVTGDMTKTAASTSWTAGAISDVAFAASDPVVGVKFTTKGAALNLMVGL